MALETGWDESSRWDGEGEMRIKIRAMPWATIACPIGAKESECTASGAEARICV